MKRLLAGLIPLFIFVGCGGGGGSSQSSTTSTTTTTITNNVALGPIAEANVSIYDLHQNLIYKTTTAALGPSDLNGTKLVTYEAQRVGKFSIPSTLLASIDDAAMLHILVNGGKDIDPNDDGNISTTDQPPLTATLEAYVLASDLKKGIVTINALSTLAAQYLAQQQITDATLVQSYLSSFAKAIFADSTANWQTLYRFNPAKLDSNGLIIDSQLLKNPQSYNTLIADTEFQTLFFGNGAWSDLIDEDRDRIPKLLETLFGSDDTAKDSDNDGINDYSELFAATQLTVDDAQEVQDALFPYQWHLLNSGQSAGAANGGVAGIDLNVTSTWANYSGNKKTTVAVVDTGIEIAHPDLATQVDRSRSYRYSDGSNDPSPDAQQLQDDSVGAAHGTACAGIIAAKSNNAIGVKGIAPDVTLLGLNVFSDPTDANFYDALSKDAKIFSNSWGITTIVLSRDPVLDEIIQNGALNGKIFIFSAGNDRALFGNANDEEFITSIYTIPVAALDANGSYASYSNFGSNILVTAPAGEDGVNYPASVTTDLTSLTFGMDTSATHFDVVGNEDGNYTNRMNGTSAACPNVTGVVALMLDANESLTYREIRYILAHTARKVDDNDPEWQQNGGGMWFNPNYGFGLVDAAAAVATASNFSPLPPLQESQLYTITTSTDIPDDNTTGVSFDINVNESFSIEFVNVWIDITHPNPGNLEITLTSPSGTVAKLAYVTPFRLSSIGFDQWRFGANNFMDEDSQGTWTVTIKDLIANDTGTLNEIKLKIYGH